MPRFFMAGTNIMGGMAVIKGRDAEHVRVLRLRPGEDMIICDGKGTDYKCRLVKADKEQAEAEVIEVVPCPAEPTVKVTVLCGLPKGDKTDYIIQKAKQSGRGIIPQVSWAGDFAAMLDIANKKELGLFMYETGEREALSEVLDKNRDVKTISIVTGPEGGFQPFEAELESEEANPITLPPRFSIAASWLKRVRVLGS